MRSLKQLRKILNEDSPANSVGSGNIAGAKGGESPPVKRKKFAGTDIFEVDSDTFMNARHGRKKWDRYAKMGNSDCANEIANYCKKNPSKGAVLKDSKTGAMLYLRRNKINEGFINDIVNKIIKKAVSMYKSKPPISSSTEKEIKKWDSEYSKKSSTEEMRQFHIKLFQLGLDEVYNDNSKYHKAWSKVLNDYFDVYNKLSGSGNNKEVSELKISKWLDTNSMYHKTKDRLLIQHVLPVLKKWVVTNVPKNDLSFFKDKYLVQTLIAHFGSKSVGNK